MSDPYFNQISLLLPLAGSNGSTTFTDYSPSPKTITRSGDAQISTAQSKWGSGSGYFDGAGNYLSVADSADFGFGTGDFTIECWCYLPGSVSGDGPLFDFRAGSGQNGLFYIDGADGRKLTYYNGTVYTGGSAVSLTAWNHLALCRASGTTKAFLNGVSQWTTTDSFDFGASRPLKIAANFAGSTGLNAYFQDLRVTKGVARYTADFTPPTAAFPTSGDSDVTGSLTATLGADTAAFTGSHVAGSLTATLSGDSATFFGSHTAEVTGSLTATLGADTAAFTGSHVAGSLAGNLDGIYIQPAITGSLTAILNLGAFAVTAGHGVTGNLTAPLAAVTGTAAGFAPLTGAFAATLATLTGIGDGRALVSGVLARALAGVRGSVAGSVAPRGTVTGTLAGIRGAIQAAHLAGTLTGRLAELGAGFRVVAAPPRPAERRSPWAVVGSVPPQTLLGPLDDAPGLTLPLISIGAIRRPADGSESANTTLTLDNGDGAVARAWAYPPLMAPVTIYSPTGTVWFDGVITGLTIAETVTVTVEG